MVFFKAYVVGTIVPTIWGFFWLLRQPHGTLSCLLYFMRHFLIFMPPSIGAWPFVMKIWNLTPKTKKWPPLRLVNPFYWCLTPCNENMESDPQNKKKMTPPQSKPPSLGAWPFLIKLLMWPLYLDAWPFVMKIWNLTPISWSLIPFWWKLYKPQKSQDI